MLDAGSSRRIYCYVSDTVEILWKILMLGKDVVYNVGGNEVTSIRDVAEIIAQIQNVRVIVPADDKGLKDAPKVVAMSIDKVVKEFDKKSFVSLKEGLTKTINWYKSEYIGGV